MCLVVGTKRRNKRVNVRFGDAMGQAMIYTLLNSDEYFMVITNPSSACMHGYVLTDPEILSMCVHACIFFFVCTSCADTIFGKNRT